MKCVIKVSRKGLFLAESRASLAATGLRDSQTRFGSRRASSFNIGIGNRERVREVLIRKRWASSKSFVRYQNFLLQVESAGSFFLRRFVDIP